MPSSAARSAASRGILRSAVSAAANARVLMMANSIEMDVALMAVMATGAQVVPVNPFLTPHELSKQLADIDARVLISDQLTAEKAANVAREFGVPHRFVLGAGGVTLDEWTRDASLALDRKALPGLDDLALIIFTGGSTGIPKGVNHTHRGLLASVYIHVDVWPVEYGRETFLNVAPMFHIWGLGVRDLGSDLRAEHARDGAALRAGQGRARA